MILCCYGAIICRWSNQRAWNWKGWKITDANYHHLFCSFWGLQHRPYSDLKCSSLERRLPHHRRSRQLLSCMRRWCSLFTSAFAYNRRAPFVQVGWCERSWSFPWWGRVESCAHRVTLRHLSCFAQWSCRGAPSAVFRACLGWQSSW